jgi:hypothetical protein
MGYRRREMLLIGCAYILAVFLTYLAIGLGLFNILYKLDAIFWLSKALYFLVGALSILLGCLAVRDYLYYKKTGRTDDMALQLPRIVKKTKSMPLWGHIIARDRRTEKGDGRAFHQRLCRWI